MTGHNRKFLVQTEDDDPIKSTNSMNKAFAFRSGGRWYKSSKPICSQCMDWYGRKPPQLCFQKNNNKKELKGKAHKKWKDRKQKCNRNKCDIESSCDDIRSHYG